MSITPCRLRESFPAGGVTGFVLAFLGPRLEYGSRLMLKDYGMAHASL